MREGLFMTMGERIRKRRQELKMSQHTLADLSGVSRPTIADIERGTRTTVNTDTILALARTLNTSVDYLLGTWEEQDSESQPADAALVSA